MQVAGRPGASRTDGVAELKRQLDVAEADIALVNRDLMNRKVSVSLRSLSKGAEASSLQHVCEVQIVPPLWRAFGPNLLKPRGKPEGVMRRLEGGRGVRSRKGCTLPKQGRDGRNGREVKRCYRP